MGVKRRVQSATGKLTSRVSNTGIVKKISNPSSANSLRNRAIEWLYLLILLLLVAGLINASANSGQAGINYNPIVQSQSAQNLSETFIMLFTYILGSLGAYTLYLSGRQTIRARSAEMFFVGGIALIAVALTLGYYILSVK